MAITLGATGTGSDYGGGNAASVSSNAMNVTTGSTIAVSSRWVGIPTTIGSVTDTAGNTYVRFGGTQHPLTNEKQDLWYAENITGHATNVVTVNFATLNPTFYGMVAAEFLGTAADANDAFASGTANAATSVTSGTFTTAQADEVLVEAGQINAGGTTWTPGSGYTFAIQDASNVIYMAYQVVSAIQTNVTASLTNSNSGNLTILVGTFKASAAGGSTWPGYVAPFGWS